MKLLFILSLGLVSSLLLVAPQVRAEEQAPSPPGTIKVPPPAPDKFKVAGGNMMEIGVPDALAFSIRGGLDVLDRVEAGVSATLSMNMHMDAQYGAKNTMNGLGGGGIPYGMGAYVKIKLHGKTYLIAEDRYLKFYGNYAELRKVNNKAVGVGYEFSDGSFLELRVGSSQLKFYSTAEHADDSATSILLAYGMKWGAGAK